LSLNISKHLRGYLVVIEGIDGSGKTTVAKHIVNMLKEGGINAIYTYEPYNEVFIHVLNSLGKRMDASFEALILAADRYYHLKEVIEPVLNKGFIVVTDRYYYSSIAYQGARGADISWIKEINKFALKPDVGIYLDIEPELGLKRKAGKPSRIEYLQEDLGILRKARQIYLDIVKSGELFYIDASLNINEVLKSCIEILCDRLNILCEKF